MESVNRLLDWLYYDCIEPLFRLFGRLLSLVFIQPLVLLQVPPWLHVVLLAVLTACFSFLLRRLLKVEQKVRRFNALFAEKRRRQQDLQLISDKYSREALYRVTDDELNSDFNTYLAHHYARYVTVYMLPVFLVLAWLNTVFTAAVITARLGHPFVLAVPANSFGISGLSVSFVFLLSYVFCLVIGFQILRRNNRMAEEETD
jgi:uncharacterized membrane protein (DUF106 family)